MSLLNIANTYEEIKGKIDLAEALSGEYVKLFFSKDGHIITHGKDFLEDYHKGTRGLVPIKGAADNTVLRVDGWGKIVVADLPIGSVSSNSAETISTSKQVKDYVDLSFAANDAMRYKGTITKTADGYTHNTTGTETPGFPTTCLVGDTYRAASPGTYYTDANGTNLHNCEVGDLLICIKDGEGEGLNTAEYWTSIQTNINGEVSHQVNGTSYPTYSNSKIPFIIFAPITGGAAGLVLISKGELKAPEWADRNALVVGEASKVTHKLSAGTGLYFEAGNTTIKFDGSADRTMNLLPATRTSIGGVIIDNRDTTKKTISVDGDGNIYLTSENIINALGYTPGSSSSMTLYNAILSNNAGSTTPIDTQTINPYINLVLTIGETKSVQGSILIIGLEAITVSAQTAINISLGKATADKYGGIKIGYTTLGINYAVLLDTNGKAFVLVPLPGLATATSDGLVPKFDGLGTGSVDANSWVLAKLSNNTYDWFRLPSNAFTNTWRLITVGGESIGDKILNFVPTGDIYLKKDSNNDGVEDISFGLSWFNISASNGDGEYEIA